MGTELLSSSSILGTNQTEDKILNTQVMNNQYSSNVEELLLTNDVNASQKEEFIVNSSAPIKEEKSADSSAVSKNIVEKDAPREDDDYENKKVKLQVEYGNRLIDTLHLKYFNNSLIMYDNTKYVTANEHFLTSCIIKYINSSASQQLCSSTLFYVKNILYDDEATVSVNTDFVNFKNGLLDLKNNRFIPHTPEIFTINQVKINYIEDFKEDNNEVNQYLDDICNHNLKRKKALLQIIGYCMTSRNNIQKFVIFYGPTASNGKSTLVKIIVAIIGNENVSHKSITRFSDKFGSNGIQGKLLNIVAELPQKRVKDTANFKSTISGDTFEDDVKHDPSTDITAYIKHIFAANELPVVDDKTEGFYRKVNILLFDNKFDVKTSTFDIDAFMSKQNLDYLGNLAIREYLEMCNSGSLEFANQEESDVLLKAYKDENDTVASFLLSDKALEFIYGNWVNRKFVFNLYKDYCSLTGLKPIGLHSFYRELREKYGFAEMSKYNHTEIDFYREYPIEKKEERTNDNN